eukprot:349642-Chlamydomonas_euryale.AAC.5
MYTHNTHRSTERFRSRFEAREAEVGLLEKLSLPGRLLWPSHSKAVSVSSSVLARPSWEGGPVAPSLPPCFLISGWDFLGNCPLPNAAALLHHVAALQNNVTALLHVAALHKNSLQTADPACGRAVACPWRPRFYAAPHATLARSTRSRRGTDDFVATNTRADRRSAESALLDAARRRPCAARRA